MSFPILLAGTLLIGWWIGRQVQDSVLRRLGGATALYVDAFVARHVQRLAGGAVDLADTDRAELAALLSDSPLGHRIVALKIWRPDGRVLFNSVGQDIGRSFPIDQGLALALLGEISSEISDRDETQRVAHGQPTLSRVIETYTPLRADRQGHVIAAAEFYQAPTELDREVTTAQRRSWLIVAGTMLGMYLLLFAVVRRGSRTIVAQQAELGLKLTQLTALNRQNSHLHQRVSRAAERAILLNENYLQRIAADVHDGPSQDLGYALMRLKTMGERFDPDGARRYSAEELKQIQRAVESALTDLRAISADLDLPDIARLGLAAIAARVVRDFRAKTEADVELVCSVPEATQASFRVKVTLYRLLQEALANAYRHARSPGTQVELSAGDAGLVVEVNDHGAGFDVKQGLAKQRLGLSGMRQRVEVLRGSFEVTSTPGRGTRIRVALPLAVGEDGDD